MLIVICVLIGGAIGWFFVGPLVNGFPPFTPPGGKGSYLPWSKRNKRSI